MLALIKRKASGKEIDLAEQEEPEHGDTLMAALQASVGGNGGKKGRRKQKASG